MFILNKFGETIASLDEYISLTEKTVFAPSGSSAGELTLEIPIGSAAVGIGDRIHTGRGDYLITRAVTSSDGGSVKLWGTELCASFAYAVIPFDISLSGTPAELIAKLLRDYGEAALPSSLSETEISVAGGDSIDFTAHAGRLSEAIFELCTLGGLGISISFSEKERGKLAAKIRAANDRRVGTAAPVVLSEQYENIADIVSEYDYRTFGNRAFVRGVCDPDGNDQYATVKLEEQGIRLSENESAFGERWIYIDEALLLSRYTIDGEYSREAYIRALTEIGKLELMKRRPTLKLEVELDEETAEKICVGDLCSMRSDGLGLLCDALCTEKTVTVVSGIERYRATLSLNT